MTKKLLLEICVETLEAAMAAQRGGADRIELCAELSVGGLTPSNALMQRVREQVKIPIFSMVRPRAGDFIYATNEFTQMGNEIALAKEEGMNGVVLGVLTRNNAIDLERTARLVELAAPLPVTFHRAFDETSDLDAALEVVVTAGVARVLTSGGAETANHGRGRIADLVRRAADRVAILAGGGIQPDNLAETVRDTGAQEFHSGLSSMLPYPRSEYAAFEEGVRNLKKVLCERSGR